MSTTSYWLAEPTDPLPRADLGGHVDVAVVGGGITGCSCALALAEAGLKVRLFEAREIAGGASGRNGGFALRGGSAPYPVLADSIGRGGDVCTLALDRRGARRARASSAGDALRSTGSLRLAVDDEERDELREEYDALEAAGFAAEWRENLPAAARRSVPRGALPSTRRRTAAGPSRPPTRAACRGSRRRDPRAHACRRPWTTPAHATVVVATDGYPSGLLGELEGLIVPTRGQVIATEPIEEMLFEIPHYGRHGFDYWHQRLDGRIVAGGFRDVSLDTEFTADEVTTPVVQNALERFVEEHVGRPVRIDYRWAGIFGMVFDFLPVVGRVPGDERLWIAGGYSGHGNVLGFASGRLVARAIAGDRDPLLDLFEPARLLVA